MPTPYMYVGLILHSTAVASASWGSFEGTMWYANAILKKLLCLQELQITHKVPLTVLRLAVATAVL